MAKRKLSQAQRVELRKAMAGGLKAGRAPGELVKEAAGKYGITTVTAAWYLKTLKGGGAKKAARPKGKKAKRSAPERNGVLTRLVWIVESKAATAARRLRAARRLVPKWRALLKKEHHLKLLESRLRRELPAISRKAKSLGEKIRAMVRA